MTLRTFVCNGIVFIDAAKVPSDGRLQRNTRLSVCADGEYIAIMDVQLPEGTKLPPGAEDHVPLRMLSDRDLIVGKDYEIRNPISPIGWLRLTDILEETPS